MLSSCLAGVTTGGQCCGSSAVSPLSDSINPAAILVVSWLNAGLASMDHSTQCWTILPGHLNTQDGSWS